MAQVRKKSKELDDNSNVLKTLEEKLGGLDWYENYLLEESPACCSNARQYLIVVKSYHCQLDQIEKILYSH